MTRIHIHLLVMMEWRCISLTFLYSFPNLFVDQKNGILLDVWRKDGGTFSGSEINVKYHATEKTGVV